MTPAAQLPIDLAVLTAQSGGDTALERDVLTIFTSEVPSLLASLAAAPARDRREIAHRLVGCARAVGAGDLARLAGAIEQGAGDLTALEDAARRALAFASAHLNGAGEAPSTP